MHKLWPQLICFQDELLLWKRNPNLPLYSVCGLFNKRMPFSVKSFWTLRCCQTCLWRESPLCAACLESASPWHAGESCRNNFQNILHRVLPMGAIQVKLTHEPDKLSHQTTKMLPTKVNSVNTAHALAVRAASLRRQRRSWQPRLVRLWRCGEVTLFPQGEWAVKTWMLHKCLMPSATHTQIVTVHPLTSAAKNNNNKPTFRQSCVPTKWFCKSVEEGHRLVWLCNTDNYPIKVMFSEVWVHLIVPQVYDRVWPLMVNLLLGVPAQLLYCSTV